MNDPRSNPSPPAPPPPSGVRQAARADVSLLDPHMVAVNAHAIASIVGTDGRIEQVNELFLQTFGYTEAEIVGAPGRILYANADSVSFEDVHATLTSGACWNGEQLLLRKDGSQFWARTTIYPLFDANGRHIKSMSLRTDITDQKRMRSELDMHAALDLFEDAMFMFTTDTLRFTYMNRKALKLWSGTDGDFVGKTPITAHPHFDRARFFEHAAPLLRGAVSQVVYVSDMYGPPHEVTLRLTRTAAGKQRFVTVERDIAERLKLEEAKDAFTATVSHELRTPLTSIKGGIDLVLAGAAGEVPEKAQRMLDIARRNADRLLLIVNDMLDLEKMAAGQMSFQMRAVDADTLIAEALSANAAYLAHFGVTARSVRCDTPQSLHCDPDRMIQVLSNLLTNAAKFSAAGDEIVVARGRDADRITISVQDFGAGIPQEAQPAIFERFTQAPGTDTARAGGTGLGLSIVKAIVEAHEGAVELRSVEGEGTTVRMFFPARSASGIGG